MNIRRDVFYPILLVLFLFVHFLPSIAVIEIAEEATKDDILVAINVGCFADDFALLGPVQIARFSVSLCVP